MSDQGNLAEATNGKSIRYNQQSFQIRRLIDLQIHQIPPQDVQCMNRFSDGYNWIDYFSNTQDIPVLNQSLGGSSIHNYEIPFRASINLWGQQDLSKSLHEQFDQFKSDISTNKIEFDPDDIVFQMAGGNDLLIQPDISTAEVMAEDMMLFLKETKLMGYQKVFVGNLPQLPYLPYLQISETDQNGLLDKIEKQNKILKENVDKLNKFFVENYNSDHEINKYRYDIFDLTNLIKNLDKYWKSINSISIPCQQGACSSHTAYQFNQLFSNKFRVRTEAEEKEQYKQFENFTKIKQLQHINNDFYNNENLVNFSNLNDKNFKNQINKSGFDYLNQKISKEFKNRFLNTRCDPAFSSKQIFQDDIHPMSHGQRRIAIGFDEFIRQTDISHLMPLKRELIGVFECGVPEFQFHSKNKDDKLEEDKRKMKQNKIKYLVRLMSDDGYDGYDFKND